MQKIMFNDKYGLTDAVLKGRKTQTRRIINPQPYYDENVGMVWKGYMNGRGLSDFEEPQASYRNFVHNSKYKVGEIVAVAMSYKSIYERVGSWEYAEEYKERHENLAGWNNKMFTNTKMPFAKIKITNARVNRLQDITHEECLLEGVYILGEDDMNSLAYLYTYDGTNKAYLTAREAYEHLINDISGKRTWDSNPYVFVYDFELVK